MERPVPPREHVFGSLWMEPLRRKQHADGFFFLSAANAADLNSKIHQAAAPCLVEFKVYMCGVSKKKERESNARTRLCPCTRLPVTAKTADNGGINGTLLAVPEGRSTTNNFDASGFLDWHVKVHVSQPQVRQARTQAGARADRWSPKAS